MSNSSKYSHIIEHNDTQFGLKNAECLRGSLQAISIYNSSPIIYLQNVPSESSGVFDRAEMIHLDASKIESVAFDSILNL